MQENTSGSSRSTEQGSGYSTRTKRRGVLKALGIALSAQTIPTLAAGSGESDDTTGPGESDMPTVRFVETRLVCEDPPAFEYMYDCGISPYQIDAEDEKIQFLIPSVSGEGGRASSAERGSSAGSEIGGSPGDGEGTPPGDGGGTLPGDDEALPFNPEEIGSGDNMMVSPDGNRIRQGNIDSLYPTNPGRLRGRSGDLVSVNNMDVPDIQLSGLDGDTISVQVMGETHEISRRGVRSISLGEMRVTGYPRINTSNEYMTYVHPTSGEEVTVKKPADEVTEHVPLELVIRDLGDLEMDFQVVSIGGGE